MKKIWHEHEVQQLAYEIAISCNTYALVSGFFHPCCHSGHISLISAAKEFAAKLIVVVNSTQSTKLKYGFEMVPIAERMDNLAEYTKVDIVLSWYGEDMSEVIRTLRPYCFCNGGDRSEKDGTICPAEIQACRDVDCRIISGCGGNQKMASNSNFLRNAQQYYGERTACLTAAADVAEKKQVGEIPPPALAGFICRKGYSVYD